MARRYSIIPQEHKCFVCGCENVKLHQHEALYGTALRKLSIQEGLVFYLCPKHHNMSDEGVHYNRELDLKLKRIAQEEWLKQHNNDMQKWMRIFRRNYL